MWHRLVPPADVPCNAAGTETFAAGAQSTPIFWFHTPPNQTFWGQEGCREHHGEVPAARAAFPGQIHADVSEGNATMSLGGSPPPCSGTETNSACISREEATSRFVRGFPWPPTPKTSFPVRSSWQARTSGPCGPGALHHHPKHHVLCRHSTSSQSWEAQNRWETLELWGRANVDSSLKKSPQTKGKH